MSIVASLTKIAVVGGIVMTAYAAISGSLPFNRAPAPVEQGFVNPQHVRVYSSVNDKGNREAFLNYESGGTKLRLPIYSGPNGPLVGDAQYYWSSISAETKSSLVAGSWDALKLETKKNILKSELEKMIENYGGGEKK